jgi:hypothetical protein
MTPLAKPVQRRTQRPFDHRGRRIVVRLEPGDILAMREERRTGWVRIAIPSLYQELVYRDALARVRNFKRRKAQLIKEGMSKREAGKLARREVRL